VNFALDKTMSWAARDEIFHIPEQDRSDRSAFKGSPRTANIDRILGPFLPAQSAIVAR